MWPGTCNYSRGGTHRSQARVPHPSKLWNETVERLHTLRRQHWQQTSFSSQHHQDLSHSSERPCLQHIQRDGSHPRCPYAARTHPHRSQTLCHRQSTSQNVFAGPNSQRHLRHSLPPSSTGYDTYQRWTRHHDNQRPHLSKCKRPSCRRTESTFSHTVTPDEDKVKIGSTAPCETSRKNGMPCLQGARPIPGDTVIQQGRQKQGVFRQQEGMKCSSSGWIGELLPVPSGFVTESDSKALIQMMEKHVESYIHEFSQSSTACKDSNLLQPSSIIHAGSLYHFKPPNLGQRDFEDWMRKHRQKKFSRSGCSSNIAFGRSISYQRSKIATSTAKTEAKNDTSFIKCMRGKLNARREVLKAIQDYHINAEARAQLEKRASDHLNYTNINISLCLFCG